MAQCGPQPVAMDQAEEPQLGATRQRSFVRHFSHANASANALSLLREQVGLVDNEGPNRLGITILENFAE